MKDGNNINEKETEYLSYQERNKLLWSLRSDFAWAGKKIPEIVEIDNEEYMLRDMIEELGEIDLLSPDEIAEIRALIPKLQEKAKVNEELLETEELTVQKQKLSVKKQPGFCGQQWTLRTGLKEKSEKREPPNSSVCSTPRSL